MMLIGNERIKNHVYEYISIAEKIEKLAEKLCEYYHELEEAQKKEKAERIMNENDNNDGDIKQAQQQDQNQASRD